MSPPEDGKEVNDRLCLNGGTNDRRLGRLFRVLFSERIPWWALVFLFLVDTEVCGQRQCLYWDASFTLLVAAALPFASGWLVIIAVVGPAN